MEEVLRTPRRSPALLIFAVIVIIGLGVAWWASTPAISDFYLRSAERLFAVHDNDAAIRNLRKADFFNAKNAQAHALQGRLMVAVVREQGEVYSDEAKEQYRSAIESFARARSLGLSPESYEQYGAFLDAEGVAYWRTANYDRADEVFGEKIHRYPDAAFLARLLLATDYIERLNKPKEAREIITRAIQESDTISSLLPDAYTIAFRVATFYEDYAETEKYAQLVLDLTGETSVKRRQLAYVHLATVSSKRGDLKTAIAWLQKVDELLGEPNRHACVLAHMYVDNRKYGLAIDAAKKRDEPRCWAALAKAYNVTGETRSAQSYAEKTLNTLVALPRKDIFTFQGIEEMKRILREQ